MNTIHQNFREYFILYLDFGKTKHMRNLLIIIAFFITTTNANAFIVCQRDTSFISIFPCEKMPLFKGGDKAMRKFIKNELKYCKDLHDGKDLKVIVSFIVTKQKQIVGSYVLRSSGENNLDNEALRIVKLLSFEEPAKTNNKAVDIRMSVVISFEKACKFN